MPENNGEPNVREDESDHYFARIINYNNIIMIIFYTTSTLHYETTELSKYFIINILFFEVQIALFTSASRT